MKKYIVQEKDSGIRLDKLIAGMLPEMSRAFWQDQIDAGAILVNDHRVKPRHIVKESDVVTYSKPSSAPHPIFDHPLPLGEGRGEGNQPHAANSPPHRENMANKIEVIFESPDVLVLNKPDNLVTHPAHGNRDDSLVHRILAYNSDISKAVYDSNNPVSLDRPGIVHRLDKDTSGVIIVAKNKLAMNFLAKQIQQRHAHKTYLALLYGWLEESPIMVKTWLNRDKYDRRKMAVSEPEKGREAETIFTIKNRLVNSKGDKVTLIEAQPITGRTHQIRVHAAHLGHPVIGDQFYGFKQSEDLSNRLGLKRQFLHALTLSIRLPDKQERSTFTAPLPDDLAKCLMNFHEAK